MYSIFGSKSKKVKYLEEGEPPPKKTVTEGDTLIKNLSKKQLGTQITLSQQINEEKEFISSQKFVDVTGLVSGKSNLKDFQTSLNNIDQINKLKTKGLDDRDIEIYKDYFNLGPNFWDKYKDINQEILRSRLQEIIQMVIKEQSDTVGTSKFQSPLDVLPNLEKDFMDTVTNYSKCDLKKIRKKARSLGNKIKDLEETVISPNVALNKALHRETLWDVKEKPPEKEHVNIINKNKKYTCKPQNLYTIKNGKIVNLNSNDTEKLKNIKEAKRKLTVEEIRKIPKFSNYDAGSPSKTLFLKNLGKKIDETSLQMLLDQSNNGSYNIRIMNGKMKGQAFVEFQDEIQATKGLEVLNGICIEGRPIIAQFGKKKDDF